MVALVKKHISLNNDGHTKRNEKRRYSSSRSNNQCNYLFLEIEVSRRPYICNSEQIHHVAHMAAAAATVVTVALAMIGMVVVVAVVAATTAIAKIADFSQMSENTNRIAPCTHTLSFETLVRNELEHEPAGTFDMMSEHAHL